MKPDLSQAKTNKYWRRTSVGAGKTGLKMVDLDMIPKSVIMNEDHINTRGAVIGLPNYIHIVSWP